MNDPASEAQSAASIRFRADRLGQVLWIGTGLVIACGIGRELAAAASGVPTFQFGFNLFRMSGEANLPSWYTATILLTCAVLLFMQFRSVAARQGPDRGAWLILTIGFFWLSADESAQLHEQLTLPLRDSLQLTDFLSFSWVVAGIPVVVVLGLFFLPFLRRLQPALRWRFVLAGLLYVGGAIGLEMISARYATYTGEQSVYTVTATLAEESFELSGATLFATALLHHLARQAAAFRLSFG